MSFLFLNNLCESSKVTDGQLSDSAFLEMSCKIQQPTKSSALTPQGIRGIGTMEGDTASPPGHTSPNTWQVHIPEAAVTLLS